MLTIDAIQRHFKKVAVGENRWRFEPRLDSSITTHRYFLTFFPKERRFVLSKQKIEPYEMASDADLVSAFEGALSEGEVADCMREAIKPSNDDDIPF